MDSLDGLGDRQLIHSALYPDLELVTRYGEEHPESWAGVWFENEPAVRIVAAFTGDTAEHEAGLRPRLRHPGRLVIQGSPHSLADLRQARQEIERTLREQAAQAGRPVLASIGLGKAVIHVALRADQEYVASDLAARYGSAVELQVGFFGFPGRRSRRPRPSGGPGLEEQAFEGLELDLEVDQAVIEAGDVSGGRLTLRNDGQERIGPLYCGQPLVGALLNAAGEVVGGYSGAIAGTGRVIDLAPGQSVSFKVIYGTASTREELGYVLPPGTYWLSVRLRFQYRLRGPAYGLTTPLVQVTVVPRAPRRGDAGR